MTRTTSYIVDEFALREALGEYNTVSMDIISMECGELYNLFVNTFGIAKDIGYNVSKEDSETVCVNLDEVVYAGVTTKINANIRIKVE